MLAMAERICRAADRLDTAGMPGPHCGDRRAAPSPHPPVLHGILQCGAHAPLVKEGCAEWNGHSAPRAYRRTAYAWWTPPSIRADLICGRDSSLVIGEKTCLVSDHYAVSVGNMKVPIDKSDTVHRT